MAPRRRKTRSPREKPAVAGAAGVGTANSSNPACSCSLVYFAFFRSAIRLCVNLSSSAVVSAWVGGGGTVARFG